MITDAPIPGSFLRGSVTKDFVTISAPSTVVIMRTIDAHFLMHWLYDMLPSTVELRHDVGTWKSVPSPRGMTERQKDDARRLSSYSDLWIRRRAAA